MSEGALESFWLEARRHARLETVPGYFGRSPLESVIPPAWSFGATPEHADGLLDLVCSGIKTATASALWDYGAEDEPLPTVGEMSIVTDSRDRPRALIRTTAVEVRPFDEVDEEHAWLEGEGDRTLESWRRVHEEFFTTHAAHDRGFSEAMPVVLERFELLFST